LRGQTLYLCCAKSQLGHASCSAVSQLTVCNFVAVWRIYCRQVDVSVFVVRSFSYVEHSSHYYCDSVAPCRRHSLAVNPFDWFQPALGSASATDGCTPVHIICRLESTLNASFYIQRLRIVVTLNLRGRIASGTRVTCACEARLLQKGSL
jgi:hypothetical protein